MPRKATSNRIAIRAALLAITFAGIAPFAAAFQQKTAAPPAAKTVSILTVSNLFAYNLRKMDAWQPLLTCFKRRTPPLPRRASM